MWLSREEPPGFIDLKDSEYLQNCDQEPIQDVLNRQEDTRVKHKEDLKSSTAPLAHVQGDVDTCLKHFPDGSLQEEGLGSWVWGMTQFRAANQLLFKKETGSLKLHDVCLARPPSPIKAHSSRGERVTAAGAAASSTALLHSGPPEPAGARTCAARPSPADPSGLQCLALGTMAAGVWVSSHIVSTACGSLEGLSSALSLRDCLSSQRP